MTLAARKPATYADILALPDHVIGEILDGELVVSPRPAPRHTRAGSAIGQDLSAFDRKSGGPPDRPGGWWILDEPELHLHDSPIVVPDLAGWRRGGMPTLPDTAYFETPPDWVCEVISPKSGGRDRIQKARIYLECGVEWFWLVEPLAQCPSRTFQP